MHRVMKFSSTEKPDAKSTLSVGNIGRSVDFSIDQLHCVLMPRFFCTQLKDRLDTK